MIAIELNGGFLELGDDTSITFIERNNALEQDAEISAPGTYPFSVRWSDTNSKLLLGIDNPARFERVIQHEVKLYLHGETMQAQLNVLRVLEQQSFDLSLSINRLKLNAGKKLNEFDYGGVRNTEGEGGNVYFSEDPLTTITKNYPDTDYAFFPVHNEDDTVHSEILNDWDILTQTFVAGGGVCMVPFPYLAYVLTTAMRQSGYDLTGRWLMDSDVKQMVLFNVYFLNVTFFPPTPLYPAGRVVYDDLDLKNHVPDVTLGELLAAVKLRFGLGFYPDFVKSEIRVASLKNMIASADHWDLTDMLTSREPDELEKRDGFLIQDDFDSNDDAGQYRKEMKVDGTRYKGEVANVAALPTTGNVEGDIYLVQDEDYYYVWVLSLTGASWEKRSYRYFDYKSGKEETRIDTRSSTLLMKRLDDAMYPGHQWTLPHVKYEVENFYSSRITDMPVRMLFYRGLRPNNLGFMYPFGSNGKVDHNLANCGNLDMRPDGLYESCYAELDALMQDQMLVTASFNIPTHMISTWDRTRKIRFMSNSYLWVERKTTYTMKEVQPTRFILMKV